MEAAIEKLSCEVSIQVLDKLPVVAETGSVSMVLVVLSKVSERSRKEGIASKMEFPVVFKREN